MSTRSLSVSSAVAVILLPVLVFAIRPAQSDNNTLETIVLLRHGEKPDDGLGQLNCKGLNRALALPAKIAEMFGRPDAIFAPNPSDQKIDGGEKYDYVRPLATIEPTAISLGLPVNTSFGVSETDKLQSALEEPGNRNTVILIVWEHNLLDKMARALLASHGGDRKEVPREWDPDDFDSIYVIRLSWAGDTAKASFEHKHEEITNLPNECPAR